MKQLTYVKEHYSNKETWLKNRGIGGSSAAAIINQSEWATQQDIYNDLVLGIKQDVRETERMNDGTITEESIRNLFKVVYKKDYKVIEPPKKGYWQFRRLDEPYLTLTPDGLLIDNKTKALGALEIKNVQMIKTAVRELWESNTLPQQYYCQALHYFIVKQDIQFLVLYAFLQYFEKDDTNNSWKNNYQKCKAYYIYREDVEKDIQYLEMKELEFINNNIRSKKRPPLLLKL